ncbi:tyrosine-type recombinase/integrase [Latilactobacillus curvatus]|uniref:tyrosine-type recombinase/integrase n=1 Tax=Latilactobacillus curvatus TaxID=28038 RepID=UPI00280BEB0B|nr:tyrosine-type recombinase/integrase [Latilactobacillus curvatus]
MPKFSSYKKKNGETAWQFQAYLGYDQVTDKQIQTRRRGFSGEREAKAAYRRLMADVEENGVSSNSMPEIKTFQELYDLWLAQYRLSVKPSSIALAKRYCEHHVLPKFGRLKLDKITVAYCQKIVNEWYQQYRQFNYLRKQTSQILKFGVNQEIIKENPMAKVTIPREKEKLHQDNFYNREQVLYFLDWAKQYPARKHSKKRIYTFFWLLAFTGMRKSEALALQWKDIDFSEKTLTIGKTLAEDEFGKVIIQEPKTENSKRRILLDDVTLRKLKEFQLVRLPYYEGKTQDQFLFTDLKGNLCYPQIANEWIEQVYLKMDRYYDQRLADANNILESSEDIDAIKQARIDVKKYAHHYKRITPHGFRHTHASLMFESAMHAGVSGESILKDVMERLGHKDIKTTMNIYTHVTKSSRVKSSLLFSDYMLNDDTLSQTLSQKEIEAK